MTKVRVYELARDCGIESKELVDFLADLGADVKNHMSVIEDDIAQMVIEHFTNGGKSGKGKKPEAQSVKAQASPQASPAAPDKGAKSAPVAARPAGPAPSAPQPPQAGGKDRRVPEQGPPSGDRARKGAPQGAEQPQSRGTLVLPDTITVKEFADKLGVPAAAIIKTLMGAGVMAGINQSIDFEAAAMVARKVGFQVKRPEAAKVSKINERDDAPESLRPRPPIVTIMGHVDHGKTTLLDTIRKSRVAASEAGGITQHVGAYQVTYEGKKITFIDTPGHEAFTAMRSRGAQVTDIAVLVVAADDGVMPQTIEAMNHAKAAGVPIIVAINKMDRPGANPDRVKQQLAEHELVPEEWGGDTIFVPISALKGDGIPDLLEMILLVAELRELVANPDRPATATVLDAELDKGRGAVAKVIVRNGTLKVGDAVIAGAVAGRVRAMFDEFGKPTKAAGPSMPVEVLGFADVPRAGDLVEVVDSEKTARQIAAERQERASNEAHRAKRVRLAELFNQVQSGDVKDLNVLVKADVQGSVEALRDSLEKASTDQVRVNVIHGAVGAITESDVNLAVASNAIIIGFNVRPESNARNLAEREGVDIRLYRVIYEALEDVEKAIEGMLEPTYEEVVTGRAEVRATFKVPGVGVVAGCYVTEGKISRGSDARVLRDNVVIYEAKVSSLKRFKDDVREVAAGYECGIGIERFNDIKEGDVIETYQMQEV